MLLTAYKPTTLTVGFGEFDENLGLARGRGRHAPTGGGESLRPILYIQKPYEDIARSVTARIGTEICKYKANCLSKQQTIDTSFFLTLSRCWRNLLNRLKESRKNRGITTTQRMKIILERIIAIISFAAIIANNNKTRV